MTSPGAGLQVLGETNQQEKDIAETSGEVAETDQHSEEKERVLILLGGMVVFCSVGNDLPFQRCLLCWGEMTGVRGLLTKAPPKRRGKYMKEVQHNLESS